MRMHSISGVGALCLLGVISACSEAEISPVPLSEKARVIEVGRQFREPVLFEEAALINNAHGRVVEECMRDKGWDFQLGTETADQIAASWFMPPIESWVFEDAGAASTVGYGWRDQLDLLGSLRAERESQDFYVPDPADLSADDALRYELDFGGGPNDMISFTTREGYVVETSGGGCLGEANNAIYGDVKSKLRFEDLRGQLSREVLDETLTDQNLRSALKGWRSCMSKEGIDVEDPPGAVVLASEMYATEGANRADAQRSEIAVAEADVRCKGEHLLADAFTSAYLLAADSRIQEFEADLLSYREFIQAAAAKARDVLGVGQ